MDMSGALTFVAGLSVATERVTEFIKRIPGFSLILSKKSDDTNRENLRVIAVHALAVAVAILVCYLFPEAVPKNRWIPATILCSQSTSYTESWRAAARVSGTARWIRFAALRRTWADSITTVRESEGLAGPASVGGI